MSENLLRSIPKVDELLAYPQIAAAMEETSHFETLSAVRQVLDGLRGAILAGKLDKIPHKDALAEAIALLVYENARMNLRPLINASGVILHTNFGRAPLAKSAVDAVLSVAKGYSNLEYDIDGGARGSRHAHVADLLKSVTGAEDAIVVNNNAAAVLLALSALCHKKEAIVSRGELVEIGGAFRVPQVMEQGGAILKEVGTTNKTKISDYEQAICPETGLLMKVHTSNFKIIGFTEEAALSDLSALGKRHNLPLLYDLGSGALMPLSPFGIGDEPTVQDAVSSGADVVCFSGDKLLGGPQAGIIVGKSQLIAKMRSHPLARALRIDKMTLAALEATLRLYLDDTKAVKSVPVLAMLNEKADSLLDRANRLCAKIAEKCPPSADIAVDTLSAPVGGGSAPGISLPSAGVTLGGGGLSAGVLEMRLRGATPAAIVGRIENDRVILDVRTIDSVDFDYIATKVCEAFLED